MSTPEEKISAAIQTAMRAGDRETTGTLRLLLNEIKNESIRSREAVDETAFLKLVRRGVKQRQESAAQYEQGGRQDLADKERREIEILEGYLPAEIDDEELRRAVAEVMEAEGLSGKAAMGPLMKEMMSRFAGRVDGGRINQFVREALTD